MYVICSSFGGCVSAYPIIVIHKGDQDYLFACLKQAAYSNPESRIILLGNNLNKIVTSPDFSYKVEHYNIDDYFQSAKEFEKIYKHHSINCPEFELFCIQRWFVINDFIKKQGIEKFLHLDSDVLLYSNFQKEKDYMEIVQKYDMTISRISGHTSFFNSQEILQKFCDFVVDLYSNDFYEKMHMDKKTGNFTHMQTKTELGYILSDMSLLYAFSNMPDVKCLDTSKIINGTLIDVCLSDHPDFAYLSDEIANIIFDKSNVPYLIKRSKNSLEPVRMHSIHFQGKKKKIMPCCMSADKNEEINQIPFSRNEIEYMFGANMLSKPKRSTGRKIANVINIFVPSKKLRERIKNKLTRKDKLEI